MNTRHIEREYSFPAESILTEGDESILTKGYESILWMVIRPALQAAMANSGAGPWV